MTHERELTLEEILNEPIVRILMEADGVTENDIRRLYRSPEEAVPTPPAFMCARLLKAA